MKHRMLLTAAAPFMLYPRHRQNSRPATSRNNELQASRKYALNQNVKSCEMPPSCCALSGRVKRGGDRNIIGRAARVNLRRA